ncbi:hypothetical protein BMS3Abin04_01075 [bacterium BMS3Abin04]|nr:hypothetical protein BMS3Abin04_01075 [bacterium BMS3Abin04]
MNMQEIFTNFKKCLFLLINCGLFITTTVSLEAQNCKSIYTIISNGNYIVVDQKYGAKDILKVNLQKGLHTVVVKRSFRIWDGYNKTDTLDVKDCSISKTLVYSLPRLSFINSTPQDALVLNKGVFLGYTPLTIPTMKNKIKLYKRNYFPQEISFSNSLENIRLVPDKTIIHKANFTDSPWFKVLVGTAVGFGATAAYFKLKADNRFDQYNQTKNKTFLDETDKFDLISGIALGALEINFGILIYYFFFD